MKFAAAILVISLVSSPVAAQRGPDPFARARNDIDRFCGRDDACRSTQRQNLGNFVTMVAGFRDPGGAVARRCLAAGRTRRGSATFVNWTVTTPCMRRAARGVPVGGTLRQDQ